MDLAVVIARDCLRLVDAASITEDSLLLRRVVWLMINGQIDAHVAAVVTHDGPAVTDIDDEHALLHEQSHNGAGAGLIQHVVAVLGERVHGVEEVGLRFLVTVYDGLTRVIRELAVFDDELMQVVSEEVGAGVATVAVKDPEEAAFGPFFDVLLDRRLHDVQDDTDAVLVVVANDALVGVSRIAHDETIFAYAALRWLPAGQI